MFSETKTKPFLKTECSFRGLLFVSLYAVSQEASSSDSQSVDVDCQLRIKNNYNIFNQGCCSSRGMLQLIKNLCEAGSSSLAILSAHSVIK